MNVRRGPALAALAFLLLASAGASSAPPLGAVAAGLDQIKLLNPLSEVSLDALSGFRDRPLFVPSRRPPPPPEPAVEAAPDPEPAPEPEPVAAEPEMPSVKLAGILEIDSEAVAVLRNEMSGTTQSVRVGDPVESWTVSAIGNDSVTLELDGRTHQIRIFQPGDGAGAPAADGGAAPPPPDPMGMSGADPSADGVQQAMPGDGSGYDDGSVADPAYDPSAADQGLSDDGSSDPSYEGADPSLMDGSSQQ